MNYSTSARRTLALYGFGVLALELLVLTPIALIANLPTQFGIVGTDAGAEFIGRGTAISAPLLPLLVLAALSLALLRSQRKQGAIITGLGLIGALFLVGALGEALAEPTADVSRSVLLASGIGVGLVAVLMVGLAVAALLEHRRTVGTGAGQTQAAH